MSNQQFKAFAFLACAIAAGLIVFTLVWKYFFWIAGLGLVFFAVRGYLKNINQAEQKAITLYRKVVDPVKEAMDR